MPKRKTSVATVTLEVLDEWQAAAQHVESHIAGTRGVHAAYYREDLSPWPIEAAETLRHKTAIVIEHIESRESLNVRAFLERIQEAAATWVTKRNFVIQFREIRHADRDAVVAAMDKLARFTNDGLPCQERLSLDLSIAEGAIWLAQFPLLAERTNGQPPFIIRHNLIRWVSWVQGAFSSAIHDWAVPGIAAIRPRQEGKRTSGASMESRERWELANVVFPRIVCDTNRTPKKLAIAEARRVGDLDVALPRIDKLLELLEVFVTAAARQPQGSIQPRCTEGLMRAVTALEELVGSVDPRGKPRSPQARTKDLRELEKDTPPLSTTDGTWVKSRRAAKMEALETSTLRSYRLHGIANTDLNLGRDEYGRVWRRQGTQTAHPWYLKSTLKSQQI